MNHQCIVMNHLELLRLTKTTCLICEEDILRSCVSNRSLCLC